MKTTQGIFVRLAVAALCFVMILCSAACSSSEKPDETAGLPTQSEQPKKKELMTEFKYSFNYTDWSVPKTDDEPFKDINEIPSNSGKIVYFNIENREATPINYQLKLTMTEGTAGSAEFGYIAPVQAAYETLGSAVRNIAESKPLDSGYVFQTLLEQMNPSPLHLCCIAQQVLSAPNQQN